MRDGVDAQGSPQLLWCRPPTRPSVCHSSGRTASAPVDPDAPGWVHLDGRRILSCLALADRCDGREVTTIKGVGDDVRARQVSEALPEAEADSRLSRRRHHAARLDEGRRVADAVALHRSLGAQHDEHVGLAGAGVADGLDTPSPLRKEHAWPPLLAPHLPLQNPRPTASWRARRPHPRLRAPRRRPSPWPHSFPRLPAPTERTQAETAVAPWPTPPNTSPTSSSQPPNRG